MAHQSNHIIVGKIGAANGVKGWVKVFSHAETPESFLSYQPWYIKKSSEFIPLEVKELKTYPKHLLVLFDGCSNRDDAAKLTNNDIYIPEDLLPELNDGGYYWKDLEGLEVISKEGKNFGHVDYLFNSGSCDILLVKNSKEESCIPYLDHVILNVDLENKQITVDWDLE